MFCSKILLIEDNPADAGLIRDMVETKEGNCVVATPDRLSSALKLLREGAFEMVLLDLGLPDSSGLETLRRILDEGPPLPVVVLTVTADEELAAQAISMGAQDYLVKGRFDPDLLYRSMLYAVERKKSQQQLKDSEERLRQAYDGLEQRVEERTAELKKAHEALQKEAMERLKAEGQLRHAQRMEAIGTFAGGVAHDFNNILAAIIGFTELMLGDTAEGSPDPHHLGRVLQASLRGRDLVKQLLAFARKSEQGRKPLRLSSAIEEAMKLLRASIPATIDIRIDIKSESGSIYCDPGQVQQVLMNLCANAVDAMEEQKGTLGIELSDFEISPDADILDIRPGPHMRLSVSDTGRGIPPEILDRIFEPFFTTKGLGRGTGLGLSVVHGIVRSCDGAIKVESRPGEGTTFRVYFPRLHDRPVEERGAELTVPRGSERILFVDDEEMLVEMGKRMLEGLGYTVTAAMSSSEALELFQRDPARFDLVVTDQTMPEMTGLELSQQLLSVRDDIPVILSTGFSHLVDADTAEAAGIRAFVMKPLTRSELARTIRSVLDGKTLNQ
jgi:signal transduction histidine kinase